MALFEDVEFERAARSLRKLLGIEYLPRPDMVTVVIKLKHHGLIKNYKRVPDNEMPDGEGYFDPFDQILCIRESTFCAANSMFAPDAERQRARFTLAHEIGHIWLKHSGIRHRGKAGALQERLVKQIRQEEREAERFAGAFLAPSYLAS
jgi:IrrE N-terminal-like domain